MQRIVAFDAKPMALPNYLEEVVHSVTDGEFKLHKCLMNVLYNVLEFYELFQSRLCHFFFAIFKMFATQYLAK